MTKALQSGELKSQKLFALVIWLSRRWLHNMIRRSRKRNSRNGGESSSKARENIMKERLESISGYDFDEDKAKEVEERIRRMSYGHKVEK